jgi:hypothetical protein
MKVPKPSNFSTLVSILLAAGSMATWPLHEPRLCPFSKGFCLFFYTNTRVSKQ